ncbi:MAG: type II toxin-antitoxin system prevent-host-death family antitoxin [Hyphomicrobium sp.]|nr:type II toxin-antitoxin system prevent-host-death family antitoxin [Hyphomicrobium sp.]
MATIGAYEAKTKFSELLDRVENGERVTITRHGRAIAELVPKREHDPKVAAAAFERMRARAQRLQLDDLSWDDIKAMRDEGKR